MKNLKTVLAVIFTCNLFAFHLSLAQAPVISRTEYPMAMWWTVYKNYNAFAYDSHGNLYIGSTEAYGNQPVLTGRIIKVEPSGVSTTVTFPIYANENRMQKIMVVDTTVFVLMLTHNTDSLGVYYDVEVVAEYDYHLNLIGYDSLLLANGSNWVADMGYDASNDRIVVLANGSTMALATFDVSPVALHQSAYVPNTTGNKMVVNNSGEITIVGTYNAKFNTAKFDSNLNLIWSRKTLSDITHDIKEDSYGNIYVCGNVYDASTMNNLKVIKYSPSGVKLWSYEYDNPISHKDDDAVSLVLNVGTTLPNTGSVYVAGTTINDDTNRVVVIKLKNTNGNEVWNKVITEAGTSSAASKMVGRKNGAQVYVLGQVAASGTFMKGMLTCAVNKDGTLAWYDIDNYENSPFAYDQTHAVDMVYNSHGSQGELACYAWIDAHDTQVSEFFGSIKMIKVFGTNSALRLIDNENQENQISLYPNPVLNKLQLISSTSINRVSVFDMQGKLILQKQLNQNENTIDVSALTSGMYVARIITDDSVCNSKFLKE